VPISENFENTLLSLALIYNFSEYFIVI